MRNRSARRFTVSAALVGVSLAGGVLLAAPAGASERSDDYGRSHHDRRSNDRDRRNNDDDDRSGDTSNRASISISGGDADARTVCANFSRSRFALQSNRCGGSRAEGGDVDIRDSVIVIEQSG
jgi:hypothetical protein